MQAQMRKALKFLHTLAACGLAGALAGYMIVLVFAPQASAGQYADMRQTIQALADYVLLPSLVIALVSGLLAIAAHRPFQEMRWVWVKALLGLGMFEATLAIIQSKANTAAGMARKIADGEGSADALAAAIASEWTALYAIMTISVANIVLGVWRPRLGRR